MQLSFELFILMFMRGSRGKDIPLVQNKYGIERRKNIGQTQPRSRLNMKNIVYNNCFWYLNSREIRSSPSSIKYCRWVSWLSRVCHISTIWSESYWRRMCKPCLTVAWRKVRLSET